MRVRYEDLVTAPVRPTLRPDRRLRRPCRRRARRSISSAATGRSSGPSWTLAHTASGNPMRFTDRPDRDHAGTSAGGPAMPASQRRTVTALTLPAARHYGYLASAPHDAGHVAVGRRRACRPMTGRPSCGPRWTAVLAQDYQGSVRGRRGIRPEPSPTWPGRWRPGAGAGQRPDTGAGRGAQHRHPGAGHRPGRVLRRRRRMAAGQAAPPRSTALRARPGAEFASCGIVVDCGGRSSAAAGRAGPR